MKIGVNLADVDAVTCDAVTETRLYHWGMTETYVGYRVNIRGADGSTANRRFDTAAQAGEFIARVKS